MRLLLLLGIACAGNAMENGLLNGESQALVPRQNNTITNTFQDCCDRHGGKLVFCCIITCVSGLGTAACWHAGGLEATKSSSTVVAGLMR